jgi:hypothetical protein
MPPAHLDKEFISLFIKPIHSNEQGEIAPLKCVGRHLFSLHVIKEKAFMFENFCPVYKKTSSFMVSVTKND